MIARSPSRPYRGGISSTRPIHVCRQRRSIAGKVGTHYPGRLSVKTMAQREARLAAGSENVKIAQLDYVTALCDLVPGALTGIGLRSGRIEMPGDEAVCGEKSPPGLLVTIKNSPAVETEIE